MIQKTAETNDLPFFIQGSEAPAFRGDFENGEYLLCGAGCGHILIEHYIKDNYINVGIKCFKCGEVTRTPGLELGEVFSASVVTLGDNGCFLLGSTVDTKAGVILTCDQELKREIETTAPRKITSPLNISFEGFQDLSAKYNELTGGQFEVQCKKVERLGASSIKTFPFAWAVIHLKTCLSNKRIDVSQGETLTALTWLNMFNHVVNTWQHHPRFRIVARGLGTPKSFLHTASQLIAAAYLYHVGNRVGLSLEDKHGEANPDLYIRTSGSNKLFLEVKAPEALQWGDVNLIDAGQVENSVKNCIKKSGAQINRSHPGILIISSSYISENFPALLEKNIQKVLTHKGRDHRSLAAVVGLSPNAVHVDRQSGADLRFNSEFHFSVTLNKYYKEENPVITSLPRQ